MTGGDMKERTQDWLRIVNTILAAIIASGILWVGSQILASGKAITALQGSVSRVQADVAEMKDRLGETYTRADAALTHDRFRDRLDDHEQRIRELEIEQGLGKKGGSG